MEIPMLPTRHNLLESGSYRVKVGEWYTMDSSISACPENEPRLSL